MYGELLRCSIYFPYRVVFQFNGIDKMMSDPDLSTCLSEGLRLGLEDLAGEVAYARRRHDLGRLALLCYCEIRRWARSAGECRLAEISGDLIAGPPAGDRDAFLHRVDVVIAEPDHVCRRCGIQATWTAH